MIRDKRRYPRARVQLHASIEGRTDQVKIADLSVGGCQIHSPHLTAGASVRLRLSLPAASETIALDGTIRWHESHRVGVEFSSIDALHTHLISNFVTRTILASARVRQIRLSALAGARSLADT